MGNPLDDALRDHDDEQRRRAEERARSEAAAGGQQTRFADLAADFVARMNRAGNPGLGPEPRSARKAKKELQRYGPRCWVLTYETGDKVRSISITPDGRVSHFVRGTDPAFEPISRTTFSPSDSQLQVLAREMAALLRHHGAS